MDVGLKAPFDIRPMEARTAETLPEGGGWQYEPKWDGFRCLVYRDGKDVELRAKSGKSLSRFFPDLVESFRTIRADNFVIDGEIVIEVGGNYLFDALQMRLHPAESRIRKLASETPAQFVVFDMLARDTESLMAQPLSARRRSAEEFVLSAKNPAVRLAECTQNIIKAKSWLGSAGAATDGVIAKRTNEPYRPGERTMVKVKRLRTADCVVGGFRYLAERREVGSLLLGLYNEDGKLDHVGFTSTIANEERPALTKKLEALRAPPGFDGRAPGGPSRWSSERSGQWEPLRQELVVEVRFDHVTGDRFRHGTKLMRWRPDKHPRQCTMEQIA